MAFKFVWLLSAVVIAASAYRRKQLAPRPVLRSDRIGSPEEYDASAKLAAAKPNPNHEAPEADAFPHKLELKFTDEAKIRAHGKHRATSDAHDNACLSAIEEVTEELGIELHGVFDDIDPELDDLMRRAEEASGIAQPDLHGIVEVKLSAEDGEHLVTTAKRLEALACVEYVSIQDKAPPPPMRFKYRADANATGRAPCHTSQASDGGIPSFVGRQGYMKADQLDAEYVQSLGADGSGIRYSDCEYAFTVNHVEFAHTQIGTGSLPIDPDNKYHDYGTASLSITVGKGGFGVHGLAPQAEAHFYSEMPKGMGYSRTRAVKAAIAGSRPGDVVLLEMQSGNPYGPAELSQSVWDLVKAGTDAGVVIVGAAGNGNRNLDDSTDDAYRARGDSGAIIVGAGNKHHQKTSFSTYGERLDVQAWGDWSVMTAGYGDCSGFDGSNDINKEYTKSFAGTSSGSAIVAGAVTLLQSWALKELGSPFKPKELRELLRSTGRPQTGSTSQNIGPHINLRAAVEKARQSGPSPTPPPATPAPTTPAPTTPAPTSPAPTSPPETDDCANKQSDRNCDHWTKAGYCNEGNTPDYRPYMLDNCKKACGGCTSATPAPTVQPTEDAQTQALKSVLAESSPELANNADLVARLTAWKTA